ncbi:MAG: tRNA guanosine(34) transglycosylase Tgt [Acidobacteriota bacterium]
MHFEVLATDGPARRGRLTTAHGVIETPCFMPVGTLGAVKGLGPHALGSLGAQVMLSNLYHLAIRPGVDAIESFGGLHQWIGWQGPIFTDSGGYQVFSLAELRKVDEDGVTFKSHHDGAMVRFTPESVTAMQRQLGVDFSMMLDECPPWPVTEAEAKESLERTQRWAERAAEDHARHRRRDVNLFGIVQGSFYSALRQQAVEQLCELDFDGYAIGGVSVGEAKTLGRDVVRQIASELPEDKPRYLMGLGTPEDLAHAVQCGVDMFDCVLPTRSARHGLLFTRKGQLRIKNARFRDDLRPIDEDCGCTACRTVSRSFMHHLFRCGEITGKVLATECNLRFFLDFMGDLRKALQSQNLAETASEKLRQLSSEAADQGN